MLNAIESRSASRVFPVHCSPTNNIGSSATRVARIGFEMESYPIIPYSFKIALNAAYLLFS